MNSWLIKRIIAAIVLIPLAVVLFGITIMYLWNWLMPELFGLKAINIWQAFGLFVLSKLLFGSMKISGEGKRRFKEKVQEKIDCMTPEERENFKAKMRERCRQWGSEKNN